MATTQCQVFDTDTNACETITQCEACAAPLAEVCEDGFDNDCDGEVDEECNLCGNNVRDEAEGEECDDNTDPNCNTNTCECINDTLP